MSYPQLIYRIKICTYKYTKMGRRKRNEWKLNPQVYVDKQASQ